MSNPWLDHHGDTGDIYLEYQGKKVAVVQSYTAKPANDGRNGYDMTLYHVYSTDDAITEDIDLFMLPAFDIVVCTWDRQIIYKDCCFISPDHGYHSGYLVSENVKVFAARRIEKLLQ